MQFNSVFRFLAIDGKAVLAVLTGLWLSGQMLFTVQAQSDVPSELIHYPEFVFHNGQVLTADADKDFTVAEAVAVRGNRIFAVGTSAEITRLVGPQTRVIDLKGRSLTPGIIYNDGDNSVPAGDLIKDSQWGGQLRPEIGGKTIDQALATMGHIIEMEALRENRSLSTCRTSGRRWR